MNLHSCNYKLFTATRAGTNTGHKYTKKAYFVKKEKKNTKGKKKHKSFILTFIAIFFVKYIGYSLVRIAFTINLFLVNEITDDYTPEQSYMGLREMSLKNRFTNHKCSLKNLSKNYSTDIF